MVHPGCLKTLPFPSTRAYTDDKYFMRAPIHILDLVNPFTFDGDTVQTSLDSLLSRYVCTEIPVTYDINLTAELDSVYLKTPMAHFTWFHLKLEHL